MCGVAHPNHAIETIVVPTAQGEVLDQKDAVVIKQSGGVTERGGVTIERSRGVLL